MAAGSRRLTGAAMTVAKTGPGHCVRKDMAISHADFMRILPAALDGTHFTRAGDLIQVEDQRGRVEIRLLPETVRTLSSLQIPRTEIELRFFDYGEHAIKAFMSRFDLHYRRGGG